MRDYERDMVCDLAETYHVFNYKELSAFQLATLVTGLRANSRVKMKLSGLDEISIETRLLALIHDHIAIMSWRQTEDARKKKNVPKSVYASLTTKPKEDKNKPIAFKTGDDFDRARTLLIQQIKDRR